MLILGMSGGLEPVYRSLLFRPNEAHDAAAVLLRDGGVRWAFEEERLNRVKHTNALPVEAIRRCLALEGCSVRDLDALAIYGAERHLNAVNQRHAAADPGRAAPDIRTLIHRLLVEQFGEDLPDDRLVFVHHHRCHAMSAFLPSGTDSSLIFTLDGVGDGLSGMVLSGRRGALKVLRELPESKSLGDFYSSIVRYLGFGDFDEYKVMGLAPYGDPAVAREVFSRMYTLLPYGDYTLHWDRVDELPGMCGPARASEEPLAQPHMDVAAALQESLEAIVMHMAAYYRESTGHQDLCLAGGVAQNCSMNGRLLASGLFRRVFVQPASYDAGCALGAAWHCAAQRQPDAVAHHRLRDVLWGSDLGTRDEVHRALASWQGLVVCEALDDPCAAAARLLADGRIVGWAQGRAEFGPRALGNRSILADPRPASHKDIVNAMVKKREAFRPFAPAILEDDVHAWFDVSAEPSTFSFMTFVVPVRADKRALLGAVTHVDGTARLQTVSREVNPLFWRVIDEFKAITGVPVVLNTSFNNNAEPIVDSVDDVVTCLLTTGLDCAIAGDMLLTKAPEWEERVLDLVAELPRHVSLQKTVAFESWTDLRERCWLTTKRKRREIGPLLFAVLERTPRQRRIRDLAADVHGVHGVQGETWDPARLAAECIAIWGDRFITLRPCRCARR